MTGPGAHEAMGTEELFRRHAPFVARLLFRFGVATDELDDVVQEVFLVVHRSGGYRPGPAKAKTYLASIAVRAASSHRRRRALDRKRTDTSLPEDLPGSSTPIEILEQDESARLLQVALAELAPDLLTTLVLVELEGETCVAVARSLGIPVGTVYWRLHRARKRFRDVVRALEARALLAPNSEVEGYSP